MNIFSTCRALALCLLGALGAASVSGATLTVTAGGDSGTGTLRDTLAGAVAGDEVVFDSAVTTVSLTSAISIGIDVEINGPGSGSLSIDGGGATRLFEVTAGTVVFSGLTMTNANAINGSGIEITGGTVTVQSCVIDSCDTTDINFQGGAIRNNGGVLNVYDSTISNCANVGSGGGGGGIWLYAGGPAVIERTTITGCSGSRCAAIGVVGSHGSMELRYCTISGNTANDTRASVYAQTGNNHVVENCTIVNNTATNDWGGLFALSGTWTIRNNTLDGNTNQDMITQASATLSNNLIGVAAVWGTSTVTSGGYNIVSDTAGTTGWVGTDSTGTAASPVDLMLGTLGNNGGPTQTMLPQTGSPAIDFVGGTGPDLDQRGLIRTGTLDAGAVEIGGSGPYSLSPNPVDLGGDITLTGEEMTQITGVTIGGVAGTLGTPTSTTLVVTLSGSTPVGPGQTVEVTAASKNQAWLSVDVVVQPPTVSGVSPDPVAPGGTLTITGSNLAGTSSVTIDGVTGVIQTATATSVDVTVSAAQATGPGQVVSLTTPGGTDSSATVEVSTSGGGGGGGGTTIGGGGGGGGGGGCAAGGVPNYAWMILVAGFSALVLATRLRNSRA